MARFRRHAFLVGLGVAVFLGTALPEGGERLRDAGFALPALTAATLFIAGLGLDGSGLGARGQAHGLLLGVLATYVAAPVLAYAVARAIGPPPAGAGSPGYFFLEALMLVAAQAGTIASAPALTLIAGGDRALALAITLATNLSTAVATPLVLRLSIGAVVDLPIGPMMTQVAMIVLLPVVAAQAFRRAFPGPTRRGLPRLVGWSQAAILAFVYTGVSAAAGHPAASPGILLRLFAAAVTLHAALLATTWAAATALRLSPASRIAVVLCGSQKTLPNGIYLWDRFFPSNPNGAVALVLYHVSQLVLDATLFAARRRGVADAFNPPD